MLRWGSVAPPVGTLDLDPLLWGLLAVPLGSGAGGVGAANCASLLMNEDLKSLGGGAGLASGGRHKCLGGDFFLEILGLRADTLVSDGSRSSRGSSCFEGDVPREEEVRFGCSSGLLYPNRVGCESVRPFFPGSPLRASPG